MLLIYSLNALHLHQYLLYYLRKKDLVDTPLQIFFHVGINTVFVELSSKKLAISSSSTEQKSANEKTEQRGVVDDANRLFFMIRMHG